MKDQSQQKCRARAAGGQSGLVRGLGPRGEQVGVTWLPTMVDTLLSGQNSVSGREL